jgi:hypothetical protein
MIEEPMLLGANWSILVQLTASREVIWEGRNSMNRLGYILWPAYSLIVRTCWAAVSPMVEQLITSTPAHDATKPLSDG